MKLLIKLSSAVGAIAVLLIAPLALASSANINFESPTYTIGNINGQDGWTKTGAFDSAVSLNTYGFISFGSQSLRISDAVTSGSFGDQTFAKPLTDAVGEAGSTNGTFSAGTLQRHFEMQFDIASTMPSEQAGMHTSISPDRGDGSRMSYLRFEDSATGINVLFDDVQGTFNSGTPIDCPTTPAYPIGTKCANFVESQIATNLSRLTPHTVKLTLDTLDGPANDVVKVWIDGSLVKTGTSWEDYYRFDHESSAEQSTRIVKTVLFRESGSATLGKGFLFDNLSYSSGPIPPVMIGPAMNKDQCKDNGWKTFNNPFYKNQGDCVSAVASNGKAKGNPIVNFLHSIF